MSVLVKKFTRYTKGRNQQVIVPKAVAVSTDVTLALFLANAATGVIGIYDANDALHTNAIVAGESFYIVQKRSDGSLRKTNLVAWNDVTVRNKLYTAPVKAVGAIGWNGSSGALSLLAAPANNKFYEFAVIETTEGNQPFPTWNYEYKSKSGDVEYDVLSALVKSVNDSTNLIYKANKPLVTAKVKVDGTYGNWTMTGTTPTITLTNKSAVITLGGTTPTHNAAIGDLISFDGAAVPTDLVGDVYKVIAVSAGVSITLDRPYAGATATLTQAQAQSGLSQKVTAYVNGGIEFTAINADEHFRLVVRQELVNATVTNLSAFVKGNGTSDRITELELEGNTQFGNTAGNTVFGNEAFGNPDKFTLDGDTYNTYHIEVNPTGRLVGDFTSGKYRQFITIAAPKSAGGISASLNTLFGTSGT
jgi:hypothetical protein